MKTTIITLFCAVSVHVFSQASVDSVLAKVERNNTTLTAYRKSIEAEKTGNKTGLTPQNPEVGFNYLWGSPSTIGNRTDLSVKQSFDFPTAYAYRNRISNLKNEQAELEYQKYRRELLLQTRLLCVEIIYRNVQLAESKVRLQNARQLAAIYKKKFDTGETNVLEYNKAQVHLLNLSKNFENNEIERRELLAELSGLNGGEGIALTDTVFAIPQLVPEFEQWYAQVELNNPVLQWLKHEVTIMQRQKQLQVAQSLPKFYAGYMIEKVVGEQFQGVMLGVTIPLWENKNTVKYAKAKTLATEGMQADSKLRFYNEMKALHAKAVALQSSTCSYREELSKFSNSRLLAKALDKGEITLGEYFIELSLYYESIDKLFDMEWSVNEACCKLLKFQ